MSTYCFECFLKEEATILYISFHYTFRTVKFIVYLSHHIKHMTHHTLHTAYHAFITLQYHNNILQHIIQIIDTMPMQWGWKLILTRFTFCTMRRSWKLISIYFTFCTMRWGWKLISIYFTFYTMRWVSKRISTRFTFDASCTIQFNSIYISR